MRGCRAPNAGSACYEVFGFDVLLDRNLKAWLIEVRSAPPRVLFGSWVVRMTFPRPCTLSTQVNVSPSLSSSSPLDKKIKNTLMTDVFHMVGFAPYDATKLAQDAEKAKLERLLGRGRGVGTLRDL